MGSKSELIISLPEDFSFEHTLSFLKRSPKELLHQVEDERIFKAILIGEQTFALQIEYQPHILIVKFLTVIPGKEQRHAIETFVREWFDLDTNLKPFYALAKKDALLKPLVKKYYGYRIVGQPDLFESITWAILGQQINLSFAYSLKERLVRNFGECIYLDSKHLYLFPTSARLSSLTPDELLALQFSRQKAQYVINVADHFNRNIISKEMLTGVPIEVAKEKLMTIKGIGNWTANYALMKTFRYRDAFPLEDAGIHNAIKNLQAMKAKPSLHQVKRIFKNYKGWEAYATLYLWKSL